MICKQRNCTWIAAGNKTEINWSERGSGDDLTKLLCTSRAIPFNPFLSSDAFRMDSRVGTSLFCRGPEHPGLAARTLKISWERLVITGSLLYFRNMAIASGDTLLSYFKRYQREFQDYPNLRIHTSWEIKTNLQCFNPKPSPLSLIRAKIQHHISMTWWMD